MRQGVHKFERSMCGLTFYRLHNKWYIRRRSSLTGRRVKTSKRFEKSRQSAAKLGIASKLAATMYRVLPPAWKLYDLYKKLTAVAIQLLHEGVDEKTVLIALEQQLYDWGYRKEINYPVIQNRKKSIVLRTPEECKKLEKAKKLKRVRNRKYEVRRRVKYRIPDFEYRILKKRQKKLNAERLTRNARLNELFGQINMARKREAPKKKAPNTSSNAQIISLRRSLSH
ncbi:MAG: hypothetical protein QM731_25245 [Chitinophagaceae bacterium]